MQHVDEGQLHAYLDGELTEPGEDPREVERHLAECAECRATMDGVRRLRERGRAMLVDPLPVEQPPFDAVIARSRRPAPSPAPARAPRRWAPLAWAASLVVALGAGWLARDVLRQGPAPELELAASMADSATPAPAPEAAAAAPAQDAATVAPIAMEESARAESAAPAATQAAGRPGEAEAGGEIALNPPAAPPTVDVGGVVALGYGTQRRQEPTGGAAAADRTEVTTAPPPPPPPTMAAPGAAAPAVPVAAPAAQATAARSARILAAPLADQAGWAVVDRSTAEQRLGAPLVLVPGLPVLGHELSVGAGGPAVRTRQRLPGGQVLTLLAQRAAPTPLEFAPARARAAGEVAGMEAAEASAEAQATRRVGALLLSGRAAVPADSLGALLERAR